MLYEVITNILSIEKDGNRTKVMVKDIEKCQLENLKTVTALSLTIKN